MTAYSTPASVAPTDRRRTAPAAPAVPTTIRWHRPLLALAALMTALAVACAVGMLVDHREVTGLNVWDKPLKFALSTAIYSVTFAWLIGQLRRLQRAAWVAGTVAAVGLLIELVIITAFAALGQTSHFNATTPVHAAAWAIMAASIGVVWTMTLVVAIVLFRQRTGDPGRMLAIRAGVILSLIGMALGALMTGPTAHQLHDYQGIAGAHTVGLPDGGPGIPILGWSTVGGDLRIPHFVGMHAVQALIIAAIVLELLGRRIPLLSDGVTRLRLVAAATAGWAALVALVLWQALIGQSIAAPAAPVLPVAVGVSVVVAIAAVAVLVAGARRAPAGHPHPAS